MPPSLEDESFDEFLIEAARLTGADAVGSYPSLPKGHALVGGRFEIVSRIGQGGTGVVYKALDHARGDTVALKTLGRMDPMGIYRLKNEFRALAGVAHPNLVRLHGLFADEGTWFFTMDLIEGQRLDLWLRSEGALDLPRLRAALRQLVLGIAAVHDAGKLHRDLKPGNVLVGGNQLWVLDFGLAADPEVGGVGQTLADESISGTPAYMSPEQAAGEPATEASDWYALGVILFEALSGQLPFTGTSREVMIAKQRDDAPDVATRAPSAPADLVALCSSLLRRDPAQRPTRAQLIASLDIDASPSVRSAAQGAVSGRLVGREHELSLLGSAYAAACDGHPVVALVSGGSGMGKSALVRQFAQELSDDGGTVVLPGRCYEAETVPFKALDAVVDALSRYLRLLGREQAIALMPRDIFALARLFPTLDRVDVVAESPSREVEEAGELLRRAFAAFHELLARIRDRQPLVLSIDDLQWTDPDSARFLRYLFNHPEPVPLLLVASYREEAVAGNSLLQSLLGWLGTNRNVRVDKVAVRPLSAAACEELTKQLCGRVDDHDAELPTRIAHEAGGSPFFVEELVRYALEDHAKVPELSISQAVLARAGRLPPLAQRVLQLLAVAGRPMASDLLLTAAHAQDEGHKALDQLRDATLIRSDAGGGLVECYHDKIRENVAGDLAEADQRNHHEALAAAVESSPDADAEALADHYYGAGERDKAAEQYVVAAQGADDKLAFERAARLRERALSIGSFAADRVRRLTIGVAEALANAGLGSEAADAYLRAAEGAEPAQQLELRRRAAERLLMGGYVEPGRALIDGVLADLGMPVVTHPGRAIASLLWQRARLAVRGFAFNERGEDEIDPLELTRVDTLYSCAFGTSMTDNIRGATYQTRHLRRALDLGEPRRVARAMALEYGFVGQMGSHNARRSDDLYLRARTIVETVEDPYPAGLLAAMRAIVGFCQGNFDDSIAAAKKALPILREYGLRTAYETTTARVFMAASTFFRGNLGDLRRQLQDPLEDAVQRNDAYSQVALTSSIMISAWLAGGDRTEAVQRQEAAERAWPDVTFDVQRLFLVWGRTLIAWYGGDWPGALRHLEESWKRFYASQLWRMESCAATYDQMYGSAAATVAAAVEGSERARLLALARRYARKLRRRHWPPATMKSELVQAAIACAERDAERAVQHLWRVEGSADAQGLRAFNAAAHWRLGRLLGGDKGTRLVTDATAAFETLGVADPARMVDLLAPGCTIE